MKIIVSKPTRFISYERVSTLLEGIGSGLLLAFGIITFTKQSADILVVPAVALMLIGGWWGFDVERRNARARHTLAHRDDVA